MKEILYSFASGNCPPCPVMISSPCHCGQCRKVKRCSSKYWSCQQPCGRNLSCGQHKCMNVCHEGPCDACPKLSLQKCFCGGEVKERPCAEPKWKCDQVREKFHQFILCQFYLIHRLVIKRCLFRCSLWFRCSEIKQLQRLFFYSFKILTNNVQTDS